MIRNIVLTFIIVACSTIACSGGGKIDDNNKPDIPTDVDKPSTPTDKSIQFWIDAHANFSRFATKENITSYLKKIKETGFNEIYLDVKPGIGYALYNSDILPKLTQWDNEKVERDWDYLRYFLEVADSLNIGVNADISTLGYGYTSAKQGLVYDSNAWDGKTQKEMVNNDPNNIVDIRDETVTSEGTPVDAAMLDPTIPEVQSFVISIISEIVTKYPKLKGICLDYCRWYGGNYGFGPASISAFETYIGKKVTNLNDIIADDGSPGSLYKDWIEFRSMTITNLITNIRTKVKAINPKIELHLWASAHWDSRYSVGQNWASKKYVPSGYVYTDTYSKTGFADQLDVFSLGAYADAVWKSEAPGSAWSVENFLTTYSKYIMGDCKVIGSIETYSYVNRNAAISDAIYLCLKNSSGVMVFELSHVINNNQWAAIADGITRGTK